MPHAVDRFACADALIVVGIAYRCGIGTITRVRHQAAAVPGQIHTRCGIFFDPDGVAHGIIDHGRRDAAILGKLRQQVSPCGIPVGVALRGECRAKRARGVGIGGFGRDIPCCVVGVYKALVQHRIVLADQLIQAIVGIAIQHAAAVRDAGDIPVCVVGVIIGAGSRCRGIARAAHDRIACHAGRALRTACHVGVADLAVKDIDKRAGRIGAGLLMLVRVPCKVKMTLQGF